MSGVWQVVGKMAWEKPEFLLYGNKYLVAEGYFKKKMKHFSVCKVFHFFSLSATLLSRAVLPSSIVSTHATIMSVLMNITVLQTFCVVHLTNRIKLMAVLMQSHLQRLCPLSPSSLTHHHTYDDDHQASLFQE